jgi:hypothetical protein
MPLTGSAAMLLSFDVDADAIAEHDDWHTLEHLPERLSIPGFVRGSRWTAVEGGPRYFVMYEVDSLDVLGSPAYLERLNNPTPWTSRMMPHYRGMTRGLCRVTGSFGSGLGNAALLVRFTPRPDAADALREWLLGTTLPALAAQRGLGNAHLFESGLKPAMTREQSIRGADAGVDWAVLVTGYRAEAVDALAANGLDAATLASRGAAACVHGRYRLHYALVRDEAGA